MHTKGLLALLEGATQGTVQEDALSRSPFFSRCAHGRAIWCKVLLVASSVRLLQTATVLEFSPTPTRAVVVATDQTLSGGQRGGGYRFAQQFLHVRNVLCFVWFNANNHLPSLCIAQLQDLARTGFRLHAHDRWPLLSPKFRHFAFPSYCH